MLSFHCLGGLKADTISPCMVSPSLGCFHLSIEKSLQVLFYFTLMVRCSVLFVTTLPTTFFFSPISKNSK